MDRLRIEQGEDGGLMLATALSILMSWRLALFVPSHVVGPNDLNV